MFRPIHLTSLSVSLYPCCSPPSLSLFSQWTWLKGVGYEGVHFSRAPQAVACRRPVRGEGEGGGVTREGERATGRKRDMEPAVRSDFLLKSFLDADISISSAPLGQWGANGGKQGGSKGDRDVGGGRREVVAIAPAGHLSRAMAVFLPRATCDSSTSPPPHSQGEKNLSLFHRERAWP